MSLYAFHYSLTLDFDGPINDHHFLLRCFPQENNRQSIKSFKCTVLSNPELTYCHDWAGNRIATGLIEQEHYAFSVQIDGIAETGQDIFESYDDGNTAILYSYATPLTISGEALTSYHQELALGTYDEPYTKALIIMRAVAEKMTYEQGITDVTTTAEEACLKGKGVCQDYAHVMLALCHLEKLPARYVVGLMAGEGKSHAWVEVLCRGIWYAFDPTNNLLIHDGYIKLSHGRDYTDCQINRGAFRGALQQKKHISASVSPLSKDH